MDITEAVRQRKSIRAYKPDAVPKPVLAEIMEAALRAPSWSNIQPWEFAIVCGKKLEEIKEAFIARAKEPAAPDLAPPEEFPEPFDSRRRAEGIKLLAAKGIAREDKEKRRQWALLGLRLFNAPCEIYIHTDRSLYYQSQLNVWPVFDCGMVAENIMLLAAACGLGTTPQIQAVFYPDVLRRILGIPDSRLIVLGIAIGYPDWNDPVNQFRSEREPLEGVTRWYGFD